jgi:hypothetical protein
MSVPSSVYPGYRCKGSVTTKRLCFGRGPGVRIRDQECEHELYCERGGTRCALAISTQTNLTVSLGRASHIQLVSDPRGSL